MKRLKTLTAFYLLSAGWMCRFDGGKGVAIDSQLQTVPSRLNERLIWCHC